MWNCARAGEDHSTNQILRFGANQLIDNLVSVLGNFVWSREHCLDLSVSNVTNKVIQVVAEFLVIAVLSPSGRRRASRIYVTCCYFGPRIGQLIPKTLGVPSLANRVYLQ